MGFFDGLMDGLNQSTNGRRAGEYSDGENLSDFIGAAVGGFFGGIKKALDDENDQRDRMRGGYYNQNDYDYDDYN